MHRRHCDRLIHATHFHDFSCSLPSHTLLNMAFGVHTYVGQWQRREGAMLRPQKHAGTHSLMSAAEPNAMWSMLSSILSWFVKALLITFAAAFSVSSYTSEDAHASPGVPVPSSCANVLNFPYVCYHSWPASESLAIGCYCLGIEGLIPDCVGANKFPNFSFFFVALGTELFESGKPLLVAFFYSIFFVFLSHSV